MPNNAFDKAAQKVGACCPYGFIRMHAHPIYTISKLVKKLGVSRACFTANRAKVRTGEVRCLKRDTCLRACWINE